MYSSILYLGNVHVHAFTCTGNKFLPSEKYAIIFIPTKFPLQYSLSSKYNFMLYSVWLFVLCTCTCTCKSGKSKCCDLQFYIYMYT